MIKTIKKSRFAAVSFICLAAVAIHLPYQCDAVAPPVPADPPVAEKPKPVIKHGRGHVEPKTPAEKIARIRLHLEKHDEHKALHARLRALVLPASWDSRTQTNSGTPWIPSIVDQGQCGSCFPEGTMIRMADGSERPIEDVRENDMVLTAEGNIGRVAATMRRPVKENLLRLDTWGHSHMEATSEHPILTKRGYVKLGEIEEGDWVAFPKYSANMVSSIRVDGFVRETKYEKHPIPDDIRLTQAFGRLSGLFLAEGSTDRARIVWSFNVTEKDTLAAETVALVRSELGMDAEITITGKGTCAKVTVFSTRLAELFQNLYGTGAVNKRLHPVLTGGTDEFLLGVLTGWMDGDKHRDRSAVSVSPLLALQMFDIANAHDFMPAMQTHTKARTDKLGIFHQHAWRINLNDAETYKRGSAFQDKTHMWRKVRKVVPGKFLDGFVFNLSVEGDHSYVAEGVAVHNCWDFSGTGVATVAFLVAQGPKAPGPLSEQYTLDCGQNGGCNGDDNTTVLAWAKATGLPTTAQYGPYQGSAGQCKSGMALYKITDWGYATPSNTNAQAAINDIKAAIMTYGCVGSGIDASSDAFGNYTTGVFAAANSSNIDHDIILVGWKDDTTVSGGGYWILRNSWGTSWGQQGYMSISYGSAGVGWEAVWAVVGAPTPPTPPSPPTPPGPTPVPTTTATITLANTGTILDGTYEMHKPGVAAAVTTVLNDAQTLSLLVSPTVPVPPNPCDAKANAVRWAQQDKINNAILDNLEAIKKQLTPQK